MIKIICDNERKLWSDGNSKAMGFNGRLEMRGDSDLVEHELATILLQLLNSVPELLESALEKATEALEHDKNN